MTITENRLESANLRFERKIQISELTRFEIESIIKHHPAIFREIYPQRYVNNIYFDTVNMSHFLDNIDGVSQRLKVRIRWYGDIFGFIKEPVLELKIKKGLVGSKRKFILKPFYFDKTYNLKMQQELFVNSNLPENIQEDIKSLRITLLNHYLRKYFISSDNKIRLTMDFNMEYYKLNQISNSFNIKNIDRKNTIIELKYSNTDAEIIESITNHLPFRLTKNSKYVTGLKNIQLV